MCGCDVVSSLKGQVISAIKYEDLATVDSIVCTHNSTVISNQKTFNAVNSHIKRLIEKRDKQNVDDVNNIFKNIYIDGNNTNHVQLSFISLAIERESFQVFFLFLLCHQIINRHCTKSDNSNSSFS